ncbi:ras-like GTP-binding protein RHO [Caerostris darwini]|uniref:Ras-like GTP-binding protein RHO n=1 Tax=Caerostris darwini TaxID=1538125 RepID=A0AAV4M9C8_9ARAC|nr:ras-like GTP-binding protein RHO [Caerostris darwini]
MSSNQAEKKVVLVGDVQCGKTGLIYNYFTDKLPDPAVPTIYKEYRTEVEVEGKKVPIVLWIVPAQDHYSAIRTLTYENSDAVILCFAIDNPASLISVTQKWFPEILEYTPNTPIVLVGNKIDLRNSELANEHVSVDQGKEVAAKIKAVKYIECSAKNGDAVKDVFKAAALATLNAS